MVKKTTFQDLNLKNSNNKTHYHKNIYEPNKNITTLIILIHLGNLINVQKIKSNSIKIIFFKK